MSLPILEHVAKTARHATPLACRRWAGDADPSSSTAGRSCRSPGAGSFRCLAALGFRAVAPDMRRSGRSQRLFAPRGLWAGSRSSPTCLNLSIRSGARKGDLGRPRFGARRSFGRSPGAIRNAVMASPTSVCPISRRASRSSGPCSWPTGRLSGPTSFRRLSGTINCSTVRISRSRSAGV